MGDKATVQPRVGTTATPRPGAPSCWVIAWRQNAYSNDGDGTRIAKTVACTAHRFPWDDADGIPLLLDDGSAQYVYGPDRLPVEQVNGATALYYDQDQLGSTRALTTSNGNVVATHTYDAYGRLASSTESVANPFGFAGEYTDAE